MNTRTAATPMHIHDDALHGNSTLARWARSAFYRIGLLRRLAKSELGSTLIYTIRVARRITHPVPFVTRSLRADGVDRLELRRSKATMYVRRRTGDLVMFHQILGKDIYSPPDEVQDRLAVLSEPLCVADVGSNIGCFTMRLLERHPGADVLAVEADPRNAALFARTIAANELDDRVRLIEAAASNSSGSIQFSAGNYFQSHVVDGGEKGTIAVRMIDILPLLEDRHFLKIDIEGSEWPILLDPRFQNLKATAITMEWHRRACPEPDPCALAETVLTDAGFTVRHGSCDPDCGTLWAWR